MLKEMAGDDNIYLPDVTGNVSIVVVVVVPNIIRLLLRTDGSIG